MCNLRLQLNGIIVNIRLLFSPRKKHSSYIVILNEIEISAPNKLIHLREQKTSDSENYNDLWEFTRKIRVLLITTGHYSKTDLTIVKIST